MGKRAQVSSRNIHHCLEFRIHQKCTPIQLDFPSFILSVFRIGERQSGQNSIIKLRFYTFCAFGCLKKNIYLNKYMSIFTVKCPCAYGKCFDVMDKDVTNSGIFINGTFINNSSFTVDEGRARVACQCAKGYQGVTCSTSRSNGVLPTQSYIVLG